MAGASTPDLPTLFAFETEAYRMQRSPCLPRQDPAMGFTAQPSSDAPVEVRATVMTFNVLSLYDPKGPGCAAVGRGMRVVAKRDVIKRQLESFGVLLCGLQETRLAGTEVLPDKHYIMLHSAAESNGHHGVALWIAKHVAYARVHGKPLFVLPEHLTVAGRSPRHLLVQINAPFLTWTVLVAHAPSETPAEPGSSAAFWAVCAHGLSRRPRNSEVVVLADANAWLGSLISPHVSDLDPEAENPAGASFHHFLADQDLWVPSTFARCHTGSSPTWTSPSGHQHRLDYVAVPLGWPPDAVSSRVQLDFEALQVHPDHVPAVLTCSLSATATSGGRPQGTFRRLAIRPTMPASPAYLQQLEAIRHAPGLTWDRPVDDHYRDLVRGWRSAGEAVCPPTAHVPTQTYLQPRTLFLVHTRRGLREYLRQERRELDRRRLLLGFAALLHARQQTVFPPQAVWRYTAWIRDISVNIARVASRIKSTGMELRSAVRADRAAYLAGLVQAVSLADLRDPKHLYRAVRRAFPKAASKRRQAFTPLPAVEDASGQLAPDREGRQELWRGHFAALENGEKLEPGAYPAAFREQRKAATAGRPCFDLGVVPTLTSVEQNVLGLRKGKACGQDGFTAELLQLSAIASARTLLPVFVKSILGVQEPVEFRGGALMPLAKKAAAAFSCSKFRAILLSSLPSKLLHKHVRTCLSAHFQPQALQAGALPGISTESVALAARAFQALCHATGRSWALIFFDVRSAFYCVIRQLLLPVGDSDRALQALFDKLHLPPASLQELRTHLESLATVSATGCSQHLQRVATDVLQGTWFRLDQDAVLTLTHCGTRPGDSLADLLFGFAFSAYLRAAQQALQEAGLATPMPTASSPDPWELGDLPDHLGCGSWADDFVHLHSRDMSAGLSRSVQRITSIYVAQADAVGMSLTFAADKTAVLLPPRARERDADWLGCVDDEGPYIPGSSPVSGQSFRLPIVSAYCHLGGIVTDSMTPAPGIGLRYALAANTVRSLGRKLFGSRLVPLDTRRCLLRSLVISKFVFGSAVIRFGSALHYRTWTRYYIALWRALFTPNPHLKTPHAYEVLAKAQAPTPPLALALARSVLLRQLASTGPATLVRLLWVQWEADPQHSWLAAVAKDIEHAAQYIDAAQVLLAARSPVRALLEAVSEDATWWTRQLKKAAVACAADVRAWMQQQAPTRSGVLDTAAPRSPGPPPSPRGFAFSCDECGASFPLRKHLAVHYARRHGRIAITRRLAPTSTCLACMKHFDSPVRVQYHLKSSATCLSRVARILRPLSLEEVREVELQAKSLKRRVDHGCWELFRTPQAVAVAAGPRILTAQERADAEGEDMALSTLSRLFHPCPTFLQEVEDFIAGRSVEGPRRTAAGFWDKRPG